MYALYVLIYVIKYTSNKIFEYNLNKKLYKYLITFG